MNISNEILHVKVEEILPNRFQPREHFAEDGIEELAKSIKEHGIIQPLVLRRLGDKFEIVAGERRYKAACMAGLSDVPAVISDIDDNKSAEIALVENIQRRNLTSIEEARSYKSILDKGYLTQDQLAQKMGVSQSAIANKLRLLNLCDEVQEALMTEKISERHARALLAVDDKLEQKKWLDRILKERLTVRQLDVELKKIGVEDEENSDIPLVNLTPDLNKIRENSFDIKPIEEPKNLSNILTPDDNLSKIDEISKPVEPIVEEKKEEPLNTNRFFNFLEDMGPNMEMTEPEPTISNEDFINNIEKDLNEAPGVVDSPNNIVENIPTNEDFINTQTNINTDTTTFDTTGMNINVQPPQNKVESLFDDDWEEPIISNTLPSNEVPLTDTINNQNELINEWNQPVVQSNIENINTWQEPIGKEPLPSNEIPLTDTISNIYASTPEIQGDSQNEVMNDWNQTAVQNNIENINAWQESIVNEPINNDNSVGLNPFVEENNDNTPIDMPQNINVFPTEIVNNNVYEEPINSINEEPNTNYSTSIDNKKIVIDPMSVIDRLDPNYQEKQEQENVINISTAISEIRKKVEDLERLGFLIDIEELDLADKYQIILNIIK